MTRRATEPEQNLQLTGETNSQKFPAEVYPDKADEDNAKRVQAVKEADYEKNTLASERKANEERKVSTGTTTVGTKVAGPADLVKSLGKSGKQ